MRGARSPALARLIVGGSRTESAADLRGGEPTMDDQTNKTSNLGERIVLDLIAAAAGGGA